MTKIQLLTLLAATVPTPKKLKDITSEPSVASFINTFKPSDSKASATKWLANTVHGNLFNRSTPKKVVKRGRVTHTSVEVDGFQVVKTTPSNNGGSLYTCKRLADNPSVPVVREGVTNKDQLFMQRIKKVVFETYGDELSKPAFKRGYAEGVEAAKTAVASVSI